jgi:hypothetical protein
MALELLYRLLIAASLLGGEVHAGYAPRYSPGVMERVARVRDLAPVDCMVSSPRYEVGAWIWVYGANTGTLLHCRVTDVSQTRDRARHLRTKREVELGFEEAQRLCGASALDKRPEQCPVIVVKVAP